MLWNADDDFEDAAFNDDQANDEALREIRREHQRINNLPVMKKARHLYLLVRALAETLPEEDDMAYHFRDILMTDAATLGAKIAAAEGGDFYTLRMENAVLVKVAARNLLSQLSGMRMLNLSEPHYLELIREEIEEFRLLFVDWIRTFDASRDIPDDWGLFYS